jgi:hypothetical protein
MRLFFRPFSDSLDIPTAQIFENLPPKAIAAQRLRAQEPKRPWGMDADSFCAG